MDLKNNDRLQKLELPSTICDDETYPTYDNLDVKFAGYGHSHLEQKKDANGKIQNITSSSGPLQIAKATVVDMNTCRNKYYGSMLTNSQMCIRIVEDEKLITYQGVCSVSLFFTSISLLLFFHLFYSNFFFFYRAIAVVP